MYQNLKVLEVSAIKYPNASSQKQLKAASGEEKGRKGKEQ